MRGMTPVDLHVSLLKCSGAVEVAVEVHEKIEGEPPKLIHPWKGGACEPTDNGTHAIG